MSSLFFAFLLVLQSSVYCLNVDPDRTIVYGPGLKPRLVFPARYFYIQAVDVTGQNFTESPGDVFSVNLKGFESPCRIWTQVLDRHDGSFIVRYRLYQTCDDLIVEIIYNDTIHVAKSPYRFDGPIYQEECNCPNDLQEWMDSMHCPDSYRQIDEDLKQFPKVDMDVVLKNAEYRFNHSGSHSFCNYAVIGNKVYRKCYGQHVGFKMFMDNILLSLTRKMTLPDIEMLVNLGDWPLEKLDVTQGAIPIFSWCGSDDSRDIVMPTYDLTESTLETMGRVMLDMLSVQSNTGPKWEDKIPIGFWRGRDSRRDRLQLVYIGKKNPHLIDAALTDFFFFPEMEEEYGPKTSRISFFDFFKYKYQIHVDGTVAAYRLPYLLAGDSVVLKQESKYYEFFYRDLEPMVHYVPFQRDLFDIVTRLEWAKSNDETVKKIARNGQNFARENLMADQIFCYHAVLFKDYAQRLVNRIKVREGMDLVEQPSDSKSQCNCRTLQIHKDEL